MAAKTKKSSKKATKSAIGKKVKSAIKKKVKKAAASKIKKAATGKIKKVVKKITKKATGFKAKIKTATKTKATAKAKGGAKTKKSTPVKKVKNIMQPVLQKITHGKDRHFIPNHNQPAPITQHEIKAEEAQFHNRQEAAMYEENQKTKSNMASRMGRKRIFRILGR